MRHRRACGSGDDPAAAARVSRCAAAAASARGDCGEPPRRAGPGVASRFAAAGSRSAASAAPRSASAIRTTRMSRARSSSSRRFSSHSTCSGVRPRHGSVYLTRPSNSTATAASSNQASTTRDQPARRSGSRPAAPAREARARRSAGGPASPAATRPARRRGATARAARARAGPAADGGRAGGQLVRRRPAREQRGVHRDDGVLERPLPGAVDAGCAPPKSAGPGRGRQTSPARSGARDMRKSCPRRQRSGSVSRTRRAERPADRADPTAERPDRG